MKFNRLFGCPRAEQIWKSTCVLLFAAALSGPAATALYNTQKETSTLLTADDALAALHLPEGFKATLFASHPQVHQPIGLAWDAKGRLWIAENYTYGEQAVNFDTNLSDQIIILSDNNGDGISDTRTIFWDKAKRLTSVAVGFGGVYALCPPQLLFIPDRDGNDVPDGEPQVLLDGWDSNAVRHNIANGLKFGPDGWLYGRHGIQATSFVGPPGASREKRTQLSCAIWRLHPTTGAFEVVAQGTTNPWGHDWDEHGQLFFINTVIGHLWHVVPGAYYKRMYGEHFNSRLYELIDQTADHFHWHKEESWSDIRRGVTSSTSRLGGGHAHSGLMIYLGDNWPEQYRHGMFTLNFHGQRVNHDRIQRRHATYLATHQPDLLQSKDPWFRGIELSYGPDGGVYILDWSDLGECHEQDGIHRTSGRIYKVTYGTPSVNRVAGMAQLPDAQLLELQLHKNEWFARMSRQLLQERAADGRPMNDVHAAARKLFTEADTAAHKLRALWLLYVTGGADTSWLQTLINDNDEHVRTWAIRLLSDQGPPSTDVVPDLLARAKQEESGLVLSFMTSLLPKLQKSERWELARVLGDKKSFAEDPVYPLLVWYGIENGINTTPREALSLATGTTLPKLRQFIARRLTEELEVTPGPVNELIKLASTTRAENFQTDILGGMTEALKGWRRATAPAAWASFEKSILENGSKAAQGLVRELSVLFGSGRAADELRLLVADKKGDVGARRRAIQALVQSRAGDLVHLLAPLLHEPEIAPDTVRALGTLGHPATAELLLTNYSRLRPSSARIEAINALASRPAFAQALLDAVENEKIPRNDLAAFQIRQLRSIADPEVFRRVQAMWPEQHKLSAEKARQAERYRKLVTAKSLAAANFANGRQLYKQSCGACHVLFGEGGTAGPDLTGSDRKNLEYLLSNILDPSALVPVDWRVATITLKDERVINGVPGMATAKTLAVQTPTEKMVLNRSDIVAVEQTNLSMMPEGLLEAFSSEQVVDLFAYLMSDRK